MAAELFAMRRGDFLAPIDAEGLDRLRALPIGKPLRVACTQSRNYEFHKRAFALIDLGFSYWEPESMVSKVEKDTCIHLAEYLAECGIDQDACYALTTQFLQRLEQRRSTTDAEKSKAAFREWVTVEAGFYDTIATPAGPRRRAKSWSFGRMGEEQFQAMYQQVLNVVWDMVLRHHFANPEEAENAASQLMSFA